MPAPTPPMPAQRPPFDRARFRRLLGMYVLGVAIGCLLVGMMLNMKKYFRPPAPPVPPSGASQPDAPSLDGRTPAAAPDGIAPAPSATPAPAPPAGN